MIVDCFTFYNEFDVLELRLETLDGVVDRFVLCEAPFTFRGEPKPLYFAGQAERFARWRDRITVLTYPGPPDADPWKNEHGQRDYLIAGLAGCAPDDLILIGDVDEIPDPGLVGKRPPPGGMLVYNLMMLRGSANRADGGGETIFPATRALLYGDVATFGGRFSVIRLMPHPALETLIGGWHFTSLGGVEVMQNKMHTYSHREYDIPYYTDRYRLEVHYGNEGGVAGAGAVPLDRLPAALRDPKWQRYIWKPRPPISAERGTELEHAHGLAGYLPPDAGHAAVLAPVPGGWDVAGPERFGKAFPGIFRSAGELAAAALDTRWLIVDGLERFPSGTLGAIARLGMSAVVYASNARSHKTLGAALAGMPYGAGRLLGRPEAEREIAAAGYRIESTGVIANRHVAWAQIPPALKRVYSLTMHPFTISEIDSGALHDFQTDAFVYVVRAYAPPADTV